MHKLYVGMCHLVIVVYDVTSKTWKKSLTDTISQVRAIKGKQTIPLYLPQLLLHITIRYTLTIISSYEHEVRYDRNW